MPNPLIESISAHSVATSDGSIIDSIENAPKFWGLALSSGVAGIANTAVSLGNLFLDKDSQMDKINLQKWLNEYDSDWAKYYRDNADSIDTWGFVATSIIPGLGGTKVLNLGQKALSVAAETGNIGRGMSVATGLLVPKSAKYVEEAAHAIAQTTSGFKWSSRNVLKALGSNFHQNLLESAAFEAGVLAATNQSPFFNDMDMGDIIYNSAVGMLLGGTVGGAIGAVGIKRGISKELKRLTAPEAKVTAQPALPSSVPDEIVLSNHFNNRLNIEKVIEDINPLNPTPRAGLGETDELVRRNLAIAQNTVRDINNKVRTSVRKALIGDSDDVGNTFASYLIKLDSRDARSITIGTDKFARFGAIPKSVDTEGTAFANKLEGDWEFRRLYGSLKGETLDSEALPDILPLADRVSSTKDIKATVDSLVSRARHTVSDGFDATKNSIDSVQTRYVKAAKGKLIPSFRKGVMQVGARDYPILEHLLDRGIDFSAGGKLILLGAKREHPVEISSMKELRDYIESSKIRDSKILLADNKSPYEIAERLNVDPEYIKGVAVSADSSRNLFYRQTIAEDEGVELTDLFYQPQYMGTRATTDKVQLRSELEVDADTLYESYRQLGQQSADVAIVGANKIMTSIADDPKLSTVYENLPEADRMAEIARDVSRVGPGGGNFSYVNGDYLTDTAAMQHLGHQKGVADRALIQALENKLNPHIQAISSNNAAATELNVVGQTIRKWAEVPYVMDETGTRIIPKAVRDYEAKLAAGESGLVEPVLPAGAPESIEFHHPEALEAWKAIQQQIQEFAAAEKVMMASKGVETNVDVESMYWIPPDSSKFKYFALVTDPTINGAGRTTMLHAASAGDLQKLISRVNKDFPELSVLMKQDSDEFHKALGDYKYSLTMHNTRMDSAMASRGISSNFLPRTDGKLIADDIMSYFRNRAVTYNGTVWQTKYEQMFRELEARGREFSRVSGASYKPLDGLASESLDNPFIDYMRIALNVTKASENKLLSGPNRWVDNAVTSLWNRARNMMAQAKSPEDLEAINRVFADHGFKTAYYDAATDLYANHAAGQLAATRFIRASNGLLATTFLRMDNLNAINNALGSALLINTELRSLIKGIKTGNEEAAGRLASISEVKIPGTDQTMLSPQRLINRSLQNFFTRPDLIQQYKNSGWITDVVTQARGIVDELALTGKESSIQLNAKLKSAIEKSKPLIEASKYVTGVKLNDFVEQFNRFLSADIARQISDIAVDAGVATAREAQSIITTFVNRTQVNLVRAQRPQAFQGPIGMALGLFQSYQFNLMQQLFRYLTPGNRLSAAMLGGMQTSIYGLNGLPGFQQFNRYIIGEAAGNYEHNDIYSSVWKAAGPDIASWLLYGAPSNILGTNLYVRGDLTPQHPTILPTSPLDFPVVAKFGQFMGNLRDTASNIGNGVGVWTSLLTGLEHNSVNRPLSGLAQVLRAATAAGKVYSTDRAGNLMSSNDLLSLTSLARLAGGRPIDESIARDNMYRTRAYRAADAAKKKELGQALARVFQAESDADPYEFFDRYLEYGGKQAGFNRWVLNTMARATESQAVFARQSLNDPYAQRLQNIINGLDPEDFMISPQ